MKTVTLEQAKKIKELGVEIDYNFSWYRIESGDVYEYIVAPINSYPIKQESFPAYQAEEMLDRMPEWIGDYGLIVRKRLKSVGGYCISYDHAETDVCLNVFEDKSLSVAVGDMFIWLAENNHLSKPNSQA